MKFNLLNTHDHNFMKKKVTAPARGPKNPGRIMPGRNSNIKEVKTSDTHTW
jgi:hypothetical protein